MGDLKDYLEEKENIFEEAPTKLLSSVTDLEEQIYKKLLTRIEEITIKGALSTDSEDLIILKKIENDIKTIIDKGNFSESVGRFLRNFDSMYELNKQIQENVNGVQLTLKNQLSPFLDSQITYVKNSLLSQGVNPAFTKPLLNSLTKVMTTGANIKDVKKMLEEFVISTEENQSPLKRYINQVSRDAVQQYDGTINQAISNEYDFNAFYYVGVLVRDSRPQCKRWVRKSILFFDELDKEITWMYSNGKGFIRGVNKDNFAIFRGGYNCLHQAIPTYQKKD